MCSLEEIDHAEDVSIAPHRLAEFRSETANDTANDTAMKGGCVPSKKECDSKLTPYYDLRSALVEDRRIVFLVERLVVPTSLRNEMLKQIHRSHIGMEGCLRRAREVLNWPLMNA